MDPTRFSRVFGNHEFEFEDVDEILKRDWFLDEDDLDDLMWSIRQDVFDKVFENRKSYTKWIYECIEFYSDIPRKMVLKIGEYTDEMEKQQEKERLRKELEDYENFEPPPRPRDSLDIRRDYLTAKVEHIKLNILNYQRCPSMYAKELSESHIELDSCENELLKTNHYNNLHNFYWKQEQWNVVRSAGGKHRSS